MNILKSQGRSMSLIPTALTTAETITMYRARVCVSLQTLRSPSILFWVPWHVRQYHANEGIYGHKGLKEKGSSSVSPAAIQNRISQSNLYRLVTAYREHGHKNAMVDPLGLKQPRKSEELDPSWYGFQSLSDTHDLEGILHTGPRQATTQEIINVLEKLYCGPLTAEFCHLPDMAEREWFAERFEATVHEEISNEEKVDMAKLMLKSQAFDIFLANKFGTVKRYGGEGAESAMCFYYELIRLASQMGINDIITCIAHRGRLNLLTCLLEYPPVTMFQKMRGKREFPQDVSGAGDVLSHLTSSVDLTFSDQSVHVTMVPNPSHLEAVNPVAAGKARARSQSRKEGEYSDNEEAQAGDSVLCFQIHGDAAFSAQGIVAETFAISNVPHYTVGGTVHFIVNNQIGFTTPSERGRSSENTSDIGKMTHCPIIRVNGDYPEEVLKASRLALEYRQKFRKDVVVDYMCFRKWGHNEMDDPSFTQPGMYQAIRSRESIPDLYAKKLANDGVCAQEDLESAVQSWNSTLSLNFNQIDSHEPKANHLEKQWAGLIQAPHKITRWDTGIDSQLLKFIGAKSVSVPEDFKTHEHIIKTHISKRQQKMMEGTGFDWATAEALALGSLLCQGFNVRISGQDVGRGTFSHRHAMLVDTNTDHAYIPLNHITPDQKAFLEIGNSILSEEAVLGFEYGVSIENPNILTIWEAQFGDFFNGAQIIIDTFVSGGETKWLLQSGLVMLLPHGIDGAGPEHSSAHLERFLQLTDSKETGVDGDNINMQIAFPTTPAQYFHLLRRQMVRNFRKPLIVASPKTLLRHPTCVSSLSDMQPSTSFKPVINDSGVKDPASVTKVIFVSGKHFYTLEKERESRGINNTALVRVEELCPFPAEDIRAELGKYSKATDFVWSQEEHRNQGAWNFVNTRFENVVGCKLRYVGRDVLATPATGVGLVHQEEVKKLIEGAFA